MEDYRTRHMRRARERRRKQMITLAVLVAVVIIVAVSAIMLKKMGPNKEPADLNMHYKLGSDEVMLLLENKEAEERGRLIDGQVYVDYETVINHLNKRFYWDSNENLILYTTPTEIIKAEVGSKNYYVVNSKETLSHTIVKTEGDKAYLSLEFVKKFSNIEYQVYQDPNRVTIQYQWGNEFLYSKVKKATQLRTEGNVKGAIIKELAAGDVVRYLDGNVEGKFAEIMTEDGLIGYVNLKHLEDSYYDSKTSDYEEPKYKSISKDETINLVWHQVTNQTANDNLLNMLSGTKGVTTVSPTWYSVNGSDGSISSLASQRYVDRAHNLGIEVWALVNDFDKDVDMMKVLSTTSSREKLSNELLAEAIKYGFDGINVDFENISLEMGRHYIQFLRELSVKCRNNGIVLSIDNYVPSPYSEYYDREEQGIIADYVIIMAYDEHHGTSEVSGSVASQPFLEKAIEDSLTMVPADKLIMGIPFYTRLWQEKAKKDGTVKVSSKVYNMTNAQKLMKDMKVDLIWDEDCSQYYGEYTTSEGTFKMWLEDEKSIEAKMKAIYNNKLAGVAEWKLGLESDGVWNVIQKYVN
ncbi:glycosyl hydrolase family 18 protein [Anaerolentibacter hominis]|uniref:glycosyl hydrolase family 18 protein n=1 Tax=Anaerolentibacter hominis TaxID=3079009 RepID=UPI0031B86A59